MIIDPIAVLGLHRQTGEALMRDRTSRRRVARVAGTRCDSGRRGAANDGIVQVRPALAPCGAADVCCVV